MSMNDPLDHEYLALCGHWVELTLCSKGMADRCADCCAELDLAEALVADAEIQRLLEGGDD